MNLRSRWMRRLLLWWSPLIVLPIVLVCAFVVWCLSTQVGTRWALTTGASFADVQLGDVQGTIWDGVEIGWLNLHTPELAVTAQNLRLRANWRALLDRTVHVRELSATDLDLALGPASPDPDEEETSDFTLPSLLPVAVLADDLAVTRFRLQQAGQPTLQVDDFRTSLALTRTGVGRLTLQDTVVHYQNMQAQVAGQAHVLSLAQPWPFSLDLQTTLVATDAHAPFCLRQYLPDLPREITPDTRGECALTATLLAHGSLDSVNLVAQARGQAVQADVHGVLLPQAGFPVQSGQVDIRLADGAGLRADLVWQPDPGGQGGQVVGDVGIDALHLHTVAGAGLPSARLTATASLVAGLTPDWMPEHLDIHADIAPGSRWQDQALQGALEVAVAFPQADFTEAWWLGLQAQKLNVSLNLDQHHVRTQGDFGVPDSRLELDVDVAALADVWPGLPGGVRAQGWIGGGVRQHAVQLDATYYQQADDPGEDAGLGQAPIQASVQAAGAWETAAPVKANPDSQAAGDTQPTQTVRDGWRGQVTALQLTHADIQVQTQSPVAVQWLADATAATQWQVGAAGLSVVVPDVPPLMVQHQGTQGGVAGIRTRGDIPRMVLTRGMVRSLRQQFASADADARGRIILLGNEHLDDVELVFRADWDLALADHLLGQARLQRLEGDFIVPADQPFPMGLTALDTTLTASAQGPGTTQLQLALHGDSRTMGSLDASLTALLRKTSEGGWEHREVDPVRFGVQTDMRDLAWVSLFAGDAFELGGRLQADLEGQLLPDMQWDASGHITGEDIRLLRVDDGIRLLDGTLAAHFEGGRLVLDSLRFPAVLRVTPKEWRTDEWVRTNPEAQDGYLELTGAWDLNDFQGGIDINLHRYPILQRADRYAMVSGALNIEVPYPVVNVSGKLDMDAGWVDLDMLSSIPTVDGDVVVIRAGQAQPESAPVNINLDLQVGLGPRFYITGYGLDSGLVGDLALRMHEGSLTATGALRTRGGSIRAYGQRLVLRQGSITFQGDIASPVLNIEALRTGQAVEAGVRVAGTARRPRIELVSYPQVNDTEKLSWLLLGRGPEESGGDAALLLSVGTSFLTEGEPFYRQLGLDELSMRSGALGSAGSVLPPESVVRGFDSGTSDIEQQFIVASKRLGDGFTLSVEQALSDTGTVGRLAYRLARGLSAQLTVGTVNGVALIYRTFFRN